MKKFFAKLHLWLAVPFGIVISILCFTGAVLVFESEIKECTNPSLYRASTDSGEILSFGELIRKVKTQVPDTVGVSSIQIPASPAKNYRLGIEGQRRTSLLVDPYTGEVKGVSRPYAKGEFFTFVRRLHRWFLLQAQGPGISWGKMITGLSTLVFVFILLSGMIIWIPKTMKGLKKRLSIKRGAGRFRFWYDFHLSLGKTASLILLVMALTGLTWSFTWYRNGFYKVFGVEVSQGSARHSPAGPGAGTGTGYSARQPGEDDPDEDNPRLNRGKGRQQAESGDEASARSENDERRGHGRPEGERGGDARGNRGGMGAGEDDRLHKYTVWQKAVANVIADQSRFRAITVQDGSVSVTLSNYGNTRAADRYLFDGRSGEITGAEYYRDEPKSTKIRGWIYAVHVGSWGGITTKVIYFIVCLIGTALPITGYYIWIKKRWKKWKKARAA